MDRVLASGPPLAMVVALITAAMVAASEPDGIALFETEIRPVLVEQCYGCHSDEAESVKGGLRLDTRAGLIDGGDGGPAVVPGDPEGSLLLEAIRYDSFVQMPPSGELPDEAVDLKARRSIIRGCIARAPPSRVISITAVLRMPAHMDMH